MEQLVARRAHNPKVISSSLVPATTKVSMVTWEPFLLVVSNKYLVGRLLVFHFIHCV